MKVNIEGVLIATGQNLKRLIKAKADEILSFFKSIYVFVKLPQNSFFFNSLFSLAGSKFIRKVDID
jgi:hypothetical protein